MKLKFVALGMLVAISGWLAPAPAYALYSGDWVKVCSSGTADSGYMGGSYQENCTWEYMSDAGGGGGTGDFGGSYGGGGGGGGGSGQLVQISDEYTVGSYHCSDCRMDDKILAPANDTISTFIKATINTSLMTWRAPDGTLRNVIICNGDCFKYQYTANGNFIRSS